MFLKALESGLSQRDFRGSDVIGVVIVVTLGVFKHAADSRSFGGVENVVLKKGKEFFPSLLCC